MPNGRFAEIVILAEDRIQVRFIRAWLAEHVSYGQIVNKLSLDGGSGEQFVRTRFPIEAELHRRRLAKRSAILIAVLDADLGEHSAHYRALLDSVADRAGIYVFVPKRNIETWLHQLTGNAADETTDYKGSYRKDPSEAIRIGAMKFVELVQSRATEGLIPSLARGIEEARRIPRLHKMPIR